MTRNRVRIIAAELARIDGAAPSEGLEKHRKMARSPFQFLRGSTQLFYADLAAGRVVLPEALLAPPLTRIQGDCHIANFGFFTEEGSHSDRIVWAPNDFDDAAVGPAAFDLLRFTASLFLVGDFLRGVAAQRHARNEFTGLDAKPPSPEDCRKAAARFIRGYATVCAKMLKNPAERDRTLDHFAKGHFLARPLKKATQRAVGGEKFATKSTVGRTTVRIDGKLRFTDDRERFQPVDDKLKETLRVVFRPYLDDDILDVVRRVGAGTGSVNVDRFYFLAGPAADLPPEELHLVQVVEAKQQRQAALIHHFPDVSPINRMAPAHLTVDCQRRMMRRPDLVLDEVIWREEHWLIRSRHNARLNIDPDEILQARKPAKALADYAAACGRVLARSHARGDRRSARFEAAMVEVLPGAAGELIDVAETYADRVIEDHRLLMDMLAGCAAAE